MKIPVILTCLLAAVLSAMPLSKAHADDVSFDVFYNSLADDGDWYNTPEYGYVWQPYIAYKTEKWKPYTDGYWAQTDDGWTWVSYENFGWATYHYGRWTRLQDTGWVWVPGYDWGPGWVSWRTSDDYVGWAPLPPKREQGVYEGRIVDDRERESRPAPRASVSIDYNDVEVEDGYNTAVDEQYDIGPDNYCFVQTHSFGAPVLREVILPPQQNIIIVENTVNVTNITYRRDRDRVFVRNGGPDFAFINGRVDRPIQHLRIDRHEDVNFLRDRTRGGGNPTLVRDGVLQVAAPNIARRPVNFTQIKPTRIKQDLPAPKIAHGWQGTGADQQTVQRVREQFKQQARNPSYRSPGAATPPPVEPRRAEREAGNTPPAPNATPGVNLPGQPGNNGPRRPLTDVEKQAKRDAAQRDREARTNPPGGQVTPGAPGQPPGAPNAPGKPLTDAEKATRRAARQGQTPPPPQGVTPPANPVPTPDADKAARRAQRQQEKQQGITPPANPTGPTDAERDARRAQRQQEKQQQQATTPPSAPTGPTDAERDARRAQRQQERQQQQAAPPSQPSGPSDAEKAARRAQRQQERPQQQAPPQRERPPQPQAPSQPSGPSDAEREARRAQRQQERQQQQQAPPQRQQERPQQQQQAPPRQQQQAPPQRQVERPQAPPQPQAQPQNQGQGQGQSDDDKKKKKDGQR